MSGEVLRVRFVVVDIGECFFGEGAERERNAAGNEIDIDYGRFAKIQRQLN